MDDHEDRYGVSWGHELMSTKSGASNKDILRAYKQYTSFHLDGNTYQLHDTVYVLASEGDPYIARILSMYENVQKKEKCMSVRWFCRACELPERVAGITYKGDCKDIFMSWGGGSKNVVNPASTIRKIKVVCTSPLWIDPAHAEELTAAADYSFSYAFHTNSLKVVSLREVTNKFGDEYVFKGTGQSSFQTTNGGSRRKTTGPGTKAAARVASSDQGSAQPAGRASAGPSLATPPLEDDIQVPHKKARVDRPVEGSRSMSELIAEANRKKKRLDPFGPNPERASLEIPVENDFSPVGPGKRLKHVSSDPNSDPAILKRPSGNRPKDVGEILERMSSIYKPNETPKFAGQKLVETELKRKQMQDRVLTPSFPFIKMPWHKALDFALEKGRVLRLQNLDPGFSSCEIETMLTELLSVSCEARMEPPKDFSCYTSGEALVMFQTRVEAEGALLKLTENALIWSEDERPVVASLATKQRLETDCFHGFLNLAQYRAESQRTGGATSHCSQPNTVVFEMGLQWRLLQEQHTKAWNIAAEMNDTLQHP